MCCCGKPTVNGELGYRWQPNDAPSVRQPNAPELGDGDVLLYDEPGRCGGIDSHCHHYRVVKNYSMLDLLVRHGGGDERINISLYNQQRDILAALDSNSRYWMLNAIYHAYNDGKQIGYRDEHYKWYMAAAERRIRTRKDRGRDSVKVWIETK